MTINVISNMVHFIGSCIIAIITIKLYGDLTMISPALLSKEPLVSEKPLKFTPLARYIYV